MKSVLSKTLHSMMMKGAGDDRKSYLYSIDCSRDRGCTQIYGCTVTLISISMDPAKVWETRRSLSVNLVSLIQGHFRQMALIQSLSILMRNEARRGTKTSFTLYIGID